MDKDFASQMIANRGQKSNAQPVPTSDGIAVPDAGAEPVVPSASEIGAVSDDSDDIEIIHEREQEQEMDTNKGGADNVDSE
jgi:hypothetical protein